MNEKSENSLLVMDFRVEEVKKVEIVIKNEFCILKGAIVRFFITVTEEIINRVFSEAQKKYQRMHYEREDLRFDKSWTGDIGENSVKEVLKELFGLVILPKPEGLSETGYDYGDIHFSKSHNSKREILNVTSRKFSSLDREFNIFVNPDQYYVLIPKDQVNQYTQRNDFCFPVFIKYIKYQNFVLNNLNLNIPIEGISVIPGFLTSTDIGYLINKNLVYVKNKNQKLKGIYSDLHYSIPMYADNYVVSVNLLRNLEVFKQFFNS